MKKQTLLVLSAGLAITASGFTFANTQSNSFRSDSSNRNVVIGSSDQSNDQQDQTSNNQDQTGSTSSTFKRKISDSRCAPKNSNSNNNNSNDAQNNTNNDNTDTQGS